MYKYSWNCPTLGLPSLVIITYLGNIMKTTILNASIISALAPAGDKKIALGHFLTLQNWFTAVAGKAQLQSVERNETNNGFIFTLADGKHIDMPDLLAASYLLVPPRGENLDSDKGKRQWLDNVQSGKINSTGLQIIAGIANTIGEVKTDTANIYAVARQCIDTAFAALQLAITDRRNTINGDFINELADKVEEQSTFTTSIDVAGQAPVTVQVDLTPVRSAKLAEFYKDKLALLSMEVFAGTKTTYEYEIGDKGVVTAQLFHVDAANIPEFCKRLEKHFNNVKLAQSAALRKFSCAELQFTIPATVATPATPATPVATPA